MCRITNPYGGSSNLSGETNIYMAKAFSSIKDPKLSLTDKLTFGKLKDCRVCDVIQDHSEYLIWAEKQGYVKFQQIVIETIAEHAGYTRWATDLEKPSSDPHHISRWFDDPKMDFSDWTEDVPF